MEENSLTELLKNEDEESEEEVEETIENESYTPTNAPYPKAEVKALLKSWLSIVAESEDFSDDLKDEIKNIPDFHYSTLLVQIQTELMKAGVYEDKDGRLTENKKRGIKIS